MNPENHVYQAPAEDVERLRTELEGDIAERVARVERELVRAEKRWTVAVDVDGVLHSYTSGWKGADVLPDPPVPGAIEWLNGIIEHFDVAICSTRAETQEGCDAIGAWLVKHGVDEGELGTRISIDGGKPAALLYVDDRGWRFTGSNFPTRDEIHAALPWWKS